MRARAESLAEGVHVATIALQVQGTFTSAFVRAKKPA
jgi:hypothetical protein